MGGLLSKAYSGPVRVLDTLPIDILRQMGGLLSKARTGEACDGCDIFWKNELTDASRALLCRTRSAAVLCDWALRHLIAGSSNCDVEISSQRLGSLLLVLFDMANDVNKRVMSSRVFHKFIVASSASVKTTPKKDEELDGIEDVNGVDENIDHETLAIDVEKLEENAKESGQKIDIMQEVHNLGKETEVDQWKFAIKFVLGANFNFILFRLLVLTFESGPGLSVQAAKTGCKGVLPSSLMLKGQRFTCEKGVNGILLFLKKAHELSQKWGNIPVVLAGDFNSMPQSAMYQFLASAKLDLQLHNRRNISGAICPLEYQPSQHQDKYAARLYS
ncbi:hypothetical protein RHGRI_017562 [Rhododendron griersonianum]|uniref:Uncharacterized protein n=1 Tax=Rhododendron griersonianum TaxID=479676 RepID=A0AAV6JY87_9ERIC|nr:hypothetical protein RHGRI_017562 [Rhododendron griersonianum]KAG5545134.1 hypothetical protein RHGRI_017562 [Rhododendron griersonianum]